MNVTGLLTISMCKLQLTQMAPSECVSVLEQYYIVYFIGISMV